MIDEAAQACPESGARSAGSCWRSRSSRCRAASAWPSRSAATPRPSLASRSRAKGVPLYTDARHYAAEGIPTVLYGAGPRTLIQEANAHRADERLPLADLHKATEVVALTLLDLLSG